MTNAFEVSDRNRIKRVAPRAHYDKETVFQILDESLIGHVSFVVDGDPQAIPMFFAREQEELIFHGSSKSRLMNVLGSGQPICVSVTLLDGLVLARSLFHHSMNYRSAIIYGCGKFWDGNADKIRGLKIMSEKMMQGRWDDARFPTDQELKATSVVALKVESAVAKVRAGAPVDDEKDLRLPVWSGTIPFATQASAPIAADDTSVPIPEYVNDWRTRFNHLTSQKHINVKPDEAWTP